MSKAKQPPRKPQSGKPQPGKSPDDEKAKQKAEDEYLNEALKGTFPASDPIAPPQFDDSTN